jgi:ADP-ribose pyrophosphatase
VETSPASPELLLQARRFQVVRMSRSLPNGTLHTNDVVLHPGAVIILPMISADRVCLIRNFRIAVGETLIELPAGTIDNREDPAVTAHRELAEETGYRAGKLEKLCEFFMSPGILNERMHLFLATDLETGNTSLESGEEIQTDVVPWQQALEMIDSGQIRDAKTLAALLYYDRLRQKANDLSPSPSGRGPG